MIIRKRRQLPEVPSTAQTAQSAPQAVPAAMDLAVQDLTMDAMDDILFDILPRAEPEPDIAPDPAPAPVVPVREPEARAARRKEEPVAPAVQTAPDPVPPPPRSTPRPVVVMKGVVDRPVTLPAPAAVPTSVPAKTGNPPSGRADLAALKSAGRARREAAAQKAAQKAATRETVAAKPAKRGRGRPRKEEAVPKPVVFELPKGMTDAMLAWACGLVVNPENTQQSHTVYRWRTGITPVPDEAKVLAKLWEELGPEAFVKVMTKVRGDGPPPPKPTKQAPLGRAWESMEELIVKILREAPAPMTSGEVCEKLAEAPIRRTTSRRSVHTTMLKLRKDGALDHDSNRWFACGNG
jgi:hypothetical protein